MNAITPQAAVDEAVLATEAVADERPMAMKLDAPAPRPGERRDDQAFRAPARSERAPARSHEPASSAMAAAFAKLQPRK